jgi:hypothetical protein
MTVPTTSEPELAVPPDEARGTHDAAVAAAVHVRGSPFGDAAFVDSLENRFHRK